MASMEGSDGVASDVQPFIEDRLESLNLVGEEEEDLDLSEELDELIKGLPLGLGTVLAQA